MLTMWGNKQSFCDGVNRRNFLKIGGLAMGGLSMAELLRAEAHAGAGSRHKSIIMVYLPGGPSHIDMYDPKPSAPAEFRGEFAPISTKISGVQFSEYLPMQAAIADKLAVIRSVANSAAEHAPSYVMSGFSEFVGRPQARPGVGAILSKLHGQVDPGVPAAVSFMGTPQGLDSGYLGAQNRPFVPDGEGRQNLTLNRSISLDRLGDRRGLLRDFDKMRSELDTSGSMTGLDAFSTRAFDIITAPKTRDALDVTKEDPRTRDRYGDNQQAQQFLVARRLVEAGVRCVTLAIGGWDTHGNNFGHLRNQLPYFDRAVASLVEDLHARGLDQDCSVVVWGEFGRTPRVNGGAGRDHWEPVMSAMVAGGGLKMGQVIGASNRKGEFAVDRPVKAPQILATLYQALGVDPAATINDHRGRPMYVLEDREPVSELLG